MAFSNFFKASPEFQMTSGPAVFGVTLVTTWSDTLPTFFVREAQGLRDTTLSLAQVMLLSTLLL